MSTLRTAELVIYFAVWAGSILYSMYKCVSASDSKSWRSCPPIYLITWLIRLLYFPLLEYSRFLQYDLVDGWSILGRKRDTADVEWNIFTSLFIHWLPYVVFYLSLSPFVKSRRAHLLPLFSIAVSFVWMLDSLGITLTLLLFLQPCVLHSIQRFTSMKFVWAICLTSTLILSSHHMSEFNV